MLILERFHSAAIFVFLNSVSVMPRTSTHIHPRSDAATYSMVLLYELATTSNHTHLQGLVFTYIVLRSSSEDNDDETRFELKSNNVTQSSTERIDFKPTSSSSEGVCIQLETMIYHDTEHENECRV